MTNAKSELLSRTHPKGILCAEIYLTPSYYDDEGKKNHLKNGYCIDNKEIFLKTPHTEEELNQFIEELDFNYDSGYGSQELDGIVWLKNGTWLTRGEYDGSEWWELHSLPDIPEELKNKQLERELNIDKIIKNP
jgi:hypothetical protein